MTSLEQTGKNIEEATQLALEQLGVTEDQVDVEILDEGAKGFLGLGQTEARVRVIVKPGVELPDRTVPAEETPDADTSIEGPPIASEAEPKAEATPVSAEVSEQVVRQAAELSREMLQNVLTGMGDKGQVNATVTDDGQVMLDMVGGETAVLIGKHGQTINALQYLVGVCTNKRLAHKVRIVLDAEGYRKRREESLRNETLYLANKVKESGQEAVFGPLEPSERRIVHLALADDPEVCTYSEGQEPDRRVVISPKK